MGPLTAPPLRHVIPPLKPPNFLPQHAQAFLRLGFALLLRSLGSLPRGTLSCVPRSHQDTEVAAYRFSPWAPVLQGYGFGEPLREADLSQHLPAPLQPCKSLAGLSPAQTVTPRGLPLG